eukprot:CAMPEP_0116099498 /NCGR_PEP_ID=MMETSP0327-20121206/11794_1 /TAXON_ID=44447 /ORGANISM="Pseudo-nitzschia delicatissima, Strain B596" /LENGTH=213 /DNA_ID=CAMNT_0003591367 /DNA_START=228 /DNA_END=869 /DNA_ORIENTATION=-
MLQATTRRLIGSAIRQRHLSRRYFSFSFASPKKLDDILKKELVQDKTKTEISDLWYSFHEGKENVIGLVLDGKEAKSLIPRAVLSPFYIQPIFRDDGHFMLVSQFFEPSHFIMAYLEDYKMDPAAAQPLMSFSVFEDYSDDKDLTLVRADILNRGLDEGEGLKVVNSMLANYMNDDQYLNVRAFNSKPDSFDLETYVAQQSEQWKTDTADVES